MVRGMTSLEIRVMTEEGKNGNERKCISLKYDVEHGACIIFALKTTSADLAGLLMVSTCVVIA